jgi:hypothetical protein
MSERDFAWLRVHYPRLLYLDLPESLRTRKQRNHRILLISKPGSNLPLFDGTTTAGLLGTFPAVDVPPGQRKSSSSVQNGGSQERLACDFKKFRKSL